MAIVIKTEAGFVDRTGKGFTWRFSNAYFFDSVKSAMCVRDKLNTKYATVIKTAPKPVYRSCGISVYPDDTEVDVYGCTSM